MRDPLRDRDDRCIFDLELTFGCRISSPSAISALIGSQVSSPAFNPEHLEEDFKARELSLRFPAVFAECNIQSLATDRLGHGTKRPAQPLFDVIETLRLKEK